MVFCGRPSKGCSHCRTRRIKCDQVKPACSQCLRAEKVCPGYRDQIELLFRDENATVLRKAWGPKPRHEGQKNKKTSTKSKAAELVHSPVPEHVNFNFLSLAWDPSISPQNLSTPADDEGIKFFFTHYVSVVSTNSAGQVILTSSPLWDAVSSNTSFYNAVSSVGFAGLSNVTKDQGHMIVARKKYAVALDEIKALLKSAPKQHLDGAFKSVLTLAVFEVVNGTPGASNSWGVHVEGAAALLRMMNPKANSMLGMRVQTQIYFSLLVKAISSAELISESMEHWAERFYSHLPSTDAPAASLIGMASKFVRLYANAKHYRIDIAGIIRQVLSLEQKLSDWEENLPQDWSFSIYRFRKEPNDAEECFHEYRDLWTARIWSNYRWARIQVNELFLIYSNGVGNFGCFHNEGGVLRRRSLATISRLSEDICISLASQLQQHQVEDAKVRKIPPLSGVFLNLYPMFVAGAAIGTPESSFEWSLKMLTEVGNNMGIHQALTMIGEVRRYREQWQSMMRCEGETGEKWCGEKRTIGQDGGSVSFHGSSTIIGVQIAE
ncbi:hypothetical protein BJ875DRAFT_448170 [Amylocarpus encephaloides]|uniref:Zn(2)-C6 fungal-type domain-containing protein n=1 Tax=Amylocarpus encephaloides TaxID=45428 RepID=A0A9P7YT42_9HELO|nr:hypothetical protein BJ875DRAFT_448170 [Amylocarpus encephaloides]